MKVCVGCKKRLSLSKFRHREGIRRSTCRACENVQNRSRAADVRYKVWEYLKDHPCVDCEVEDPVILEFDHVSGCKHKTVSEMIKKAYAWKTVKKEIEKCEVRCANCHRLKTAKERNYWVYEKEYG